MFKYSLSPKGEVASLKTATLSRYVYSLDNLSVFYDCGTKFSSNIDFFIDAETTTLFSINFSFYSKKFDSPDSRHLNLNIIRFNDAHFRVWLSTEKKIKRFDIFPDSILINKIVVGVVELGALCTKVDQNSQTDIFFLQEKAKEFSDSFFTLTSNELLLHETKFSESNTVLRIINLVIDNQIETLQEKLMRLSVSTPVL